MLTFWDQLYDVLGSEAPESDRRSSWLSPTFYEEVIGPIIQYFYLASLIMRVNFGRFIDRFDAGRHVCLNSGESFLL